MSDGRVTTTVFTGAWGEHFKSFIPGWWEAVLAMDPLPDEVVIVYRDPDVLGMSDAVPNTPFPVKRIPWTGVCTVANLWNCAITVSYTHLTLPTKA